MNFWTLAAGAGLSSQVVLGLGTLGALTMGFVKPVRAESSALILKMFAVFIVAAAAFCAVNIFPDGAPHALVRSDAMAWSWQILICAAALPLALVWESGHEARLALFLGSLVGMGLLAVSSNLLLLFVSLELMSLPLYLLVVTGSGRLKADEAALKYFFAGGTAGAFYLMGLALFYAATRSFDFATVAGLSSTPLAQTGIALMGTAALFKIGAFPLHFWLPDVYEASDAELAGFFSTAVKAAGVIFLMRLAALNPGSFFARALPFFAAATMLFGSLLALRQTNLKRLLAYGSIAHAGTLILGVSAWAVQGAAQASASAVYFYLWVYLFASNGAFLFLKQSGLETRADLRGYAARHSGAASAGAALLLTLGGVPPTGGFLVELLIFWEAVKAHLYAPVLIAALAALIALVYYLGLIRDIYFDEPKGDRPQAGARSAVVSAVMWLCAAATVVIGLLPFEVRIWTLR